MMPRMIKKKESSKCCLSLKIQFWNIEKVEVASKNKSNSWNAAELCCKNRVGFDSFFCMLAASPSTNNIFGVELKRKPLKK